MADPEGLNQFRNAAKTLVIHSSGLKLNDGETEAWDIWISERERKNESSVSVTQGMVQRC